LLHSPHGGKKNRLGNWKALVEAVEAGKIKSIGVSNYGIHHLEELEQWQKEQKAAGKNGGVLSVNQIELHPWLARPDLVKWCNDHGVVLEAYSPLTRGVRLQEPVLGKLGKKHAKTTAQILLRWSLQKVRVAHNAVIRSNSFNTGIRNTSEICYAE
jgi:diketogulonate reductase-like aldo/keto reductase